MTETPKPLFNVDQASAYLGLAKSTLAKMRLSGGGPIFHKLGRRIFYRKDDIDDWLNRHRFASTSEYELTKSIPNNEPKC